MINDYYTELSLQVATTTVNAYGVEEKSYVIHQIQGAINQASSKEIESAKARNIDIDYKVYVEVNSVTKAIKKDDIINEFRVVSNPKNTFTMDHHLKILLKELV